MYNGQRVSRHLQQLESTAMGAGTGYAEDQYDDYGVPLSKNNAKNNSGNKKSGFINRFKRSGNNSSKNSPNNFNDDDSDDDGTFDMPGIPRPNTGSGFKVMNGQQPFPQPQQQPHQQQQQQQQPQQQDFHPGLASPQSVRSASPNQTPGSDIGMDQLSSIRDRFRYPSMGGDNRTMSLNSLSTYDTTPIIPMLGPLTSFQSGSSHNKTNTSQEKYRQRMIESRRALLSTESGVPLSGNPQNPQGPPNGVPPPQMPMELPMTGNVSTRSRATSVTSNHSTSSLNNRTNTMNSQMSQMSHNQQWRPQMAPQMMNQQMNPQMMSPQMMNPQMMSPQMMNPQMMSPQMQQGGPNMPQMQMYPPQMQMGGGGPPRPMSPGMGQQQFQQNNQQNNQQLPMPRYNNNSRGVQHHSPLSQSHEPGNEFDFGTINKDKSEIDTQAIASLEDEVRVLSIELGESVRRELKMAPSSVQADTAQELSEAYKKLSLERAKRQSLEESAKTKNIDVDKQTELSDLKFSHDEATHLLAMRTDQYESLQKRYQSLEADFQKSKETMEALDRQVKDYGEAGAMYTQDKKLQDEIDVLKTENLKLRKQMDSLSDRGPLGDRVKALEDQRTALQEALRAMRERKDAEIKALNTKVESLTTALNKRSISTSSIYGNPSSTSLSSRTNLSIFPRRVTSNEPEEPLSMPKRSRDVSIGRPSTPLNLGLEYSKPQA